MGTAYHAGVEALNRGKSIDDAAGAIAACGLEEFDATRISCLVAGWQWRWGNAPAFRKVLAAEQVFEFPLPGHTNRRPKLYAGKIDVIGELDDGRVAVGEYKTATEKLDKGSDYWRRLLIDRQISGYIVGARVLGYPAETVLYDAARLPGLRQKLLTKQQRALTGEPDGTRESLDQYAARLMDDIAARPDWYYARETIDRLDADIARQLDELAMYGKMIDTARKLNHWPRNTDACRSIWGLCPYFGPCADNYDPVARGVPAGFKKVEDVHVELTLMESDREEAAT